MNEAAAVITLTHKTKKTLNSSIGIYDSSDASYLVLLKMLVLTTLLTDKVTNIFSEEKSRTVVLVFVGSDLKRKTV